MRWLALAFAAVATGCMPGAPGEPGPLAITAEPVEIGPGMLNGLALQGAYVLTAPAPEFGGLSGIDIVSRRVLIATDQGWWLDAQLEESETGAIPGEAELIQMVTEDGTTFDKAGGDAEGVTFNLGDVFVSFERDHRVMSGSPSDPMTALVRDPAFEALPLNGGIEALATLPDGRLLGIAEEHQGGAHPMFVIGQDGTVETTSLPLLPPHLVTGADLGPDGRLYVVRRHFSAITGVSIRIHRYTLGEDGLPLPETAQELAAYESASGIDNMEGIALWQDDEGRTRLTLISDDNFNIVQRTLWMDFVVED